MSPRRPVIVVGVDDTPEAAEAFRFAVELARERHAVVRAVHAYSVPYLPERPLLAVAEAEEEYRDAAAVTLAAVVAAVPIVDVDVDEVLVEGPAQDVLIEEATGADLLIVGAHHRRLATLWRSVAAETVRAAPCPVIIVPARRTRPSPVA
jgi:nucleotide-binding universal stress UspA family protein